MRTPEQKYKEYLAKGRTLQQMICVAAARGDQPFHQYLKNIGEIESRIW